jgi:hypothetical protein
VATASKRNAAPLGLRVPFSQEMAVTVGTLSNVANSICVQPSLARMARISFAGMAFTGGGSFTVRSRAFLSGGEAFDASHKLSGIEMNLHFLRFRFHWLYLALL